MRLPLINGEVDKAVFSQMIDLYLSCGFNYFDTAHGYLDGQSETALRECLVSRYPRESFILANKLTNSFFHKEGGVRPLFESQLKACGTTYFDWYLMHSQTAVTYEKYKRLNCFETVNSLKEEGKIRHIGISFHDKPSVLDRILSEQPKIEAVQIQFNFLDYEDAAVESRLCYEICRKHNKKVFVMEPVKGGILSDYYSLALRFAGNFEGVEYVLSGMSSVSQIKENASIFSDFKPLTLEEKTKIDSIVSEIKKTDLIQCTSCRYCTAGCPEQIPIPDIFACLNSKKKYNSNHFDFYYNLVCANVRPSSCIECGKCERVCPQHLPIRDYLKLATEAFENSNH